MNKLPFITPYNPTLIIQPLFPTDLHQQASEVITEFFMQNTSTDTVLLTNSCARGKAVAESDLDMVVLLKWGTPIEQKQQLEAAWNGLRCSHPLLTAFVHSHPFVQIHLDVIEGQYEPSVWDDGGGPDYFEVAIGNHLVYSQPLSDKGNHFKMVQEKWLPYYDSTLQQVRLEMVKNACVYDLEHIPFFVKRHLYFQAFDRLYKSFQQFLQALFISRKVYPIAYNKWIHEQVTDLLHLPELYNQLPPIISVSNIQSGELSEKAAHVKALLLEYIG